MNRRLSLVLTALLVAGTASADLKIVSDVQSTGMASMGDGRTVTYIKGMKMRTEPQKGDTMILDMEKRQMILLIDKKQRAEVHDLAPLAQQQVAIGAQEVSLEATGNTREVAGYTCEDHNISLVMSAASEAAPGINMDLSMKGPVCLSKKAPGAEQMLEFYTAMAEKGLFFGPPQSAQSQPGRERGMTELYRAMSEKGVGLSSTLTVGFEGEGMMARMMKKMGFTTTSTVVEISDDSLPDSLFEIPAGYKVKNK